MCSCRCDQDLYRGHLSPCPVSLREECQSEPMMKKCTHVFLGLRSLGTAQVGPLLRGYDQGVGLGWGFI